MEQKLSWYTLGLTIFRGIQALDKDKPNTANSDLSYGIISGNDDKKFSIEGNIKLKTLYNYIYNHLAFHSGVWIF